MAEWYVRHVTVPVAQAVQHLSDASLVSLEDVALAGLVTAAGAGAWWALRAPTRSGKVRRTIAAAGSAAIAVTLYAGAIIGVPSWRAPLVLRHEAPLVEVSDAFLKCSYARGTAAMRSYDARQSLSSLPSDAQVCGQVAQTLRDMGEPTIATQCRDRSSLLWRLRGVFAPVQGAEFDPMMREMHIGVPHGNWWRMGYVAHESAHANLILPEGEAEFIAYLALANAHGEHADAMRYAAAVLRSVSSRRALVSRGYDPEPLSIPARLRDDLGAISRSLTRAQERMTAQQIARASKIVQVYDFGFLNSLASWEARYEPTLPQECR